MSETYLEHSLDRISANPAKWPSTETSGSNSCDRRYYPPVTKVTDANGR